MRHVPVFLNLLGLLFGMACLARLFSDYALVRDRASLSRLAFFASYTFLLVVGFCFSYYIINIGPGIEAEYAFAGLIFIGMGAIELTFPWMIRSPARRPASKGRLAFFAACAAITSAQAAMLWILPAPQSSLPLILAFVPFTAVIALGIADARSQAGPPLMSRKESLLFLLYIPILALAVVEVVLLTRPGRGGPNALLSLPLAYALTSFQFFRISPHSRPMARSSRLAAQAEASELPRSLIERKGLSPREAEIARLILQGKANKEIAGQLSLSENTVRNHIYALYKKLGIQRRMDLVLLARGEEEGAGT
jgi:DNA-binding CsgD family transcriptional regulator